MLLILFVDFIVVTSLVVSSRKRLEDAFPIFCFCLALIPLESRFVISGLFDLSTERIALVTLLVLFFIRRPPSVKRVIPLKYLMIVHVCFLIYSTVHSLAVGTSAKLLIAQVIEYYLLYYIFVRTISDVRTVYRIVYAMILAMGLCCIFGLCEAYASWSILSVFPSNLWGSAPLYIDEARGLRIRATFPHPILFGDALAMTIPMALYLLSVWKNQRRRVILWIASLLMCWALYKTSSRGPWLTLGISFVLLFVMVKNRIRKYLGAIALLSIAVIVARPGIRESLVNLYESTQDSSSVVGSSYEYRHALIPAVTNALGKSSLRMIAGYGMGTFREIGLDINFLNVTQRWHTCDSNWTLFLYETGYVGLGIIAVLLFKPLGKGLLDYRRLPKPEKYFLGVMLISLAGFYVSLLSVAGYNWGQQGFMAWIVISLIVVYPKIVMHDRRKEATSKLAARLFQHGGENRVPTLQLW